MQTVSNGVQEVVATDDDPGDVDHVAHNCEDATTPVRHAAPHWPGGRQGHLREPFVRLTRVAGGR